LIVIPAKYMSIKAAITLIGIATPIIKVGLRSLKNNTSIRIANIAPINALVETFATILLIYDD